MSMAQWYRCSEDAPSAKWRQDEGLSSGERAAVACPRRPVRTWPFGRQSSGGRPPAPAATSGGGNPEVIGSIVAFDAFVGDCISIHTQTGKRERAEDIYFASGRALRSIGSEPGNMDDVLAGWLRAILAKSQ